MFVCTRAHSNIRIFESFIDFSRYNPLLDRADVRHFDVYPADRESARLPDLEPGTSYEMAIMAFNNLGESNYTTEAAIVTTSSE